MITIDCPECFDLIDPDMECVECYGTGTLAIYCRRCLKRPADREQDEEPVCADCETIRVCRCGEQWCRAEWCALPLVGMASTQDGFAYDSSMRNCTCGSTLTCPIWMERDNRKLRCCDRAMVARGRLSQRWTPARWLLRVGWDRAVVCALGSGVWA